MRFSAAVKVPCDSGDRRTGRALGRTPRDWEEDVLAAVTVEVVELMDGREVVVLLDVDEDDEDVFR